MWCGLIMLGFLATAAGGGDLDTLDMEIASLDGQRAQLGDFKHNAKRDELDRKIALLREVRNRAGGIIARRTQACLDAALKGAAPASQPGPGPQPGPTPPAQTPAALQQQALAASCLQAAQSVVPRVRRAEEIKFRLKYEDWNAGNNDERKGLQRELETLEAGLL